MRVLVTGGSGFVGGHTVAALRRAGHEVRVLARRPEQVRLTLGPLGVSVDDVAAGDVLDEATVLRALQGMEAVVHAAAVYTTDPRAQDEVRRTNARATRIVLGQAVRAGMDPVVHVSSVAALARHGSSGPELPLGDMTHPYAKSKIQSEALARELQDEGYPVVCVYPGAVHGPDDPYLGDNNERVLAVLRGRFPLWPKGGLHYVDVRDVADVIVAVAEPGRGPRRYVVPGHHVGGPEYYATLGRVSGRRIRHIDVPAGLLEAAMRPADRLMKHLPDRVRFPADAEGIALFRRDTRLDDGPTRTEFALSPRTLEETLRDTTRWLLDSGRLRARQVPALA